MRLGESNGAGIDARGEEAEKREVGLLMRDMDRVGVGKKSEFVMRGETREKIIGENGSRINGAVPDFAEPCEAGRHAEPRAEMRVPLARSDASFLPILPAGVGSDELHDFGGRMQAAVGEIAEGALGVTADDYAADVENKGGMGAAATAILWALRKRGARAVRR